MEGAKFTKHTGKETNVSIISENKINGGDYGAIFDTIIEVGKHKKRFIVKKYHIFKDKNKCLEYAKKALKNYEYAKKAGLKVFPTFRISEEDASILMTTGFRNNEICVGTNRNNNTESNLERPLILEIQNFDNFLKEIFNQGIKAAKSCISIPEDAMFIITDREEPANLSFVIGDLDELHQFENIDETIVAENIRFNLKNIKWAVAGFLKRMVSPDKFNDLFNMVLNYHKTFTDE